MTKYRADILSTPIKVYEHSKKGSEHRNILAKGTFYSQRIRVRVLPDKIIFEHVSEMYDGKSLLPYQKESGWCTFSISCDHLDFGDYPIDEDESNEDRIVFYLKKDEDVD